MSTPRSSRPVLPRPRLGIDLVLAFGLAYFLSSLVRAVTATLAPTLTAQLGLSASDLGLLAGAYFLGFACMQLPLGRWLDRFGPKPVLVLLLCISVVGAMSFSWSAGFIGLCVSRFVMGVGVSACLMAPLTYYRQRLEVATQMKANAWMLMTGSMGMLASTLPVQWLLPLWGWRTLFVWLGVLLALSTLAIVVSVPGWPGRSDVPERQAHGPNSTPNSGYHLVWQNPTFQRLALLGFFNYGGMLAIQTLWAGPWLVEVCGLSAGAAATGLFALNAWMLLSYWAWGWALPRLYARGVQAQQLITWGTPLSLLLLGFHVLFAQSTQVWTLTLYCVFSTVLALPQPLVGAAFPPALAGRALSAFNLLIFAGVFTVQWGIGLIIDILKQFSWPPIAAMQGAWGLFFMCCFWGYVFFVSKRDNASLAQAES